MESTHCPKEYNLEDMVVMVEPDSEGKPDKAYFRWKAANTTGDGENIYQAMSMSLYGDELDEDRHIKVARAMLQNAYNEAARL